MTTFDSLPPETLFRVLELAFEHDLDSFVEYKAALGTLASASLVSRSLKAPAQSLMWYRLRLYRPGESERITASPVCGKYRTAQVALETIVLGQDETVEGVLGKLQGIERLELSRFRSNLECVGWLSLPSLQRAYPLSRFAGLARTDLSSADLTTLSIDYPGPGIIPPNHLPSFCLQTLTLAGYACSQPTALAHILLASSSATLLTLNLDYNPRVADPTLLSSLHLVANHLASLTLRRLIPGLGPILSSFTALTHIRLNLYSVHDLPECDNFIVALRAPIESFHLWIVYHHFDIDEEGFVPALSQRLGERAWDKVTAIRLYLPWQDVERTGAGKELEELCRAKGIAMEEW